MSSQEVDDDLLDHVLSPSSQESSAPGPAFVVPKTVKRRIGQVDSTSAATDSVLRRRVTSKTPVRDAVVAVKQEPRDDAEPHRGQPAQWAAHWAGSERKRSRSEDEREHQRRRYAKETPSPEAERRPRLARMVDTGRSAKVKQQSRSHSRSRQRSGRSGRASGGGASSGAYRTCYICKKALLPGQALGRNRLNAHASCLSDRRSETDFFSAPGREVVLIPLTDLLLFESFVFF